MKKDVDPWKDKLTSEEYTVLRKNGTEAPFSGELLENKEDGMYHCKACGVQLFSSDAKFDSGSGWPSFDDAEDLENIVLLEDSSHGMRRVEVRCKFCDSHLGHLFEDGPTKTGKRYCVNSLSLDFKKKEN